MKLHNPKSHPHHPDHKPKSFLPRGTKPRILHPYKFPEVKEKLEAARGLDLRKPGGRGTHGLLPTPEEYNFAITNNLLLGVKIKICNVARLSPLTEHTAAK